MINSESGSGDFRNEEQFRGQRKRRGYLDLSILRLEKNGVSDRDIFQRTRIERDAIRRIVSFRTRLRVIE